MRTAERPGSTGFTLVELMIVVVLLAPLLLVVGASSRAVVGSISINERAAETTEVAVRALGQLEQILQFGRLGTLRVQATRADVRAGRAAAVGDWFPMPPLEPRDSFEVWSTTGERDLALQIPSQPFRFAFVREAAELANGSDDDGDGLVDEGELRLTRDGMTTRVLDRIELCEFELEDRVVHVTLRYGRRGHGQQVRRTTLHHTVFLQNY